jgi:hypothetical protein
MSNIASLNSENALLKQQLVHAQAEKSLQQSLLAAQRVALAAKDGEVQALRALASLGIACGSAGATPGSTSASSRDEQRKRARVVDDSSLRSPLDKDELLDTVFSYVGVDDYLFAAGVCRRWRGRYIKLCYNKAVDKVDKLCTTYSSAFMTAARLQLAFKSGLEVEKLHGYKHLASDISRYSIEPIAALAVAKTYDMRYPEDIAQTAAFCCRLQLLQWLHERRCPWPEADVLKWAAMGGSVEVLSWLHSVTAPWADATKAGLLDDAGFSDNLDAAKWLKETAQAPWPDDMHAASIVKDAAYCLVGERVARWVLARADCCWDSWDCKSLAAQQHMSEAGKQRAAELFALAHQHGCPCTCTAAD